MTFTDFKQIKEDMAFLGDWQEKYAYVIDLGKLMQPLESVEMDEDHLVPGCVSRAWLYFEENNDTLIFRSFSEALIVNGLIYIVSSLYNNKSFTEALSLDSEQILKELGLAEHLSPNRVNGLRSILHSIKVYTEKKV